jgi:hypothetical protein
VVIERPLSTNLWLTISVPLCAQLWSRALISLEHLHDPHARPQVRSPSLSELARESLHILNNSTVDWIDFGINPYHKPNACANRFLDNVLNAWTMGATFSVCHFCPCQLASSRTQSIPSQPSLCNFPGDVAAVSFVSHLIVLCVVVDSRVFVCRGNIGFSLVSKAACPPVGYVVFSQF